MKRKPNSDHLKDAATLLLKGGTLINDPCPSCSGLQVRFQDENVCVNECQLHQISANDTGQAPIENDLSIDAIKKMMDAISKEKLVNILQTLRQENDLSKQKILAELIELYLRILSGLRQVKDV
ncbi:Sjogren's syndrome/scleroderma autoantigen 1 family protein [Nitrososphaera sp. AFS]|uniref:Sjogren's syndrome/scleroderma autoantigen 1 family protein n=1 Tax=Nitrososphaera sp. AFS TaxID=2301191 RepID=UPI001392482F|nr:Sjogren's syndrome/scleroderma autoantigen 1 family protein [Nitrososphaera sp. AFS]NAL77276.1 hypothetical protein [Nitrososphaera sp. AFS]